MIVTVSEAENPNKDLPLNLALTAAWFPSNQYEWFLYGKEVQKERKVWYFWLNERCDTEGTSCSSITTHRPIRITANFQIDRCRWMNFSLKFCFPLFGNPNFLSPTFAKLRPRKFLIRRHHLHTSRFSFTPVQIHLAQNMRLVSDALSPLTSIQKIALLSSQGVDCIVSFSWPWRVIYSFNFCLRKYDFHGRSYLCRE